MVIGGNDIPQGRQAFFNALYDDLVRERIAQMLQFQIGRRVGNEQSATIAHGGSADEATAGNGGVNDGNVVTQFRFKHRVKVLRTTDSWEIHRIRYGKVLVFVKERAV